MRVLMKAITSNDVAQVRALLQEGVDINQRYLADYPLEAAIRTGSLELVQAFLESGVDVNFGNTAKVTLLRFYLGRAKVAADG